MSKSEQQSGYCVLPITNSGKLYADCEFPVFDSHAEADKHCRQKNGLFGFGGKFQVFTVESARAKFGHFEIEERQPAN